MAENRIPSEAERQREPEESPDELSVEELEDVAGGVEEEDDTNYVACGANYQCPPKPA